MAQKIVMRLIKFIFCGIKSTLWILVAIVDYADGCKGL